MNRTSLTTAEMAGNPAGADRDAPAIGAAVGHLSAVAQAAHGGPEEVRKMIGQARSVFRDCPNPALKAVRLYNLGAWRRHRNQLRSAWVLLSAAADLFSQAGDIYHAASVLVTLSQMAGEAGEIVEQQRLRQRFLAMLRAVDPTGPYYGRLVFDALHWAQALGIPAAHCGEMSALLHSCRRVYESCRSAPERSDPDPGGTR